ncbi:MAG TPA: response regulator [Vulgatibacter sp.]
MRPPTFMGETGASPGACGTGPGVQRVGILGKSRARRIRESLETRSRRILVVDHDALSRERLSEILEAEGFEVESLGAGDDELLRSDLNRFDLAVIDARAPTADGSPLLPLLRQTAQGAALPVVLMAAELAGETMARGRALECAGFVTKPVDERIFVETLRALLG